MPGRSGSVGAPGSNLWSDPARRLDPTPPARPAGYGAGPSAVLREHEHGVRSDGERPWNGIWSYRPDTALQSPLKVPQNRPLYPCQSLLKRNRHRPPRGRPTT